MALAVSAMGSSQVISGRASEMLVPVENVHGRFDHAATETFEHAVFVAVIVFGFGNSDHPHAAIRAWRSL
jgi:hypothetical protein